MPNATQHIGIVACTAEGAALCYTTICVEGAALLGPHAHPEVTLHTPDFSRYMDCLYRDDWAGVAELMLGSAQKLAQVGADFLICPDNTIHRAFPLVRPRSPLPWLHIAEEVAADAARQGCRKLGLLGTKYLVESEVYPDKLTERGIGLIRPEPEQRERINRIIFDELVYGKFTREALGYFVGVIDSLGRQGCDGVVLGCTEIPLLVSQADSPLPVLDSTRLLARAALRKAVGTRRNLQTGAGA